jgi:hypothetical protein
MTLLTQSSVLCLELTLLWYESSKSLDLAGEMTRMR